MQRQVAHLISILDSPCKQELCDNHYYTERRCCHKCARMNGYFKDDITSLKAEYQFTLDKGFWNNGCVLPIEKRSGACLSYFCQSAANTLSDETLKEIKIARNQDLV